VTQVIVVMMGVTGSGKTTIGTLLSQRSGAVFADGDDYHPPANKAKMAAGIPLTDEDRLPWLQALNRLLKQWHDTGTNGVLACSALKHSYRQTLSAGLPDDAIQFVSLEGSPGLIASRLAMRHHEYMNPKLLESQFNILELPQHAIRIVNDKPPNKVVDEIIDHLPGFAR
jgi:gluconokinase